MSHTTDDYYLVENSWKTLFITNSELNPTSVAGILLHYAFDPRTVQPIASRYTDWAIPAPRIGNYPVQNEGWLRSTDYWRQARDIHERVLDVNESILYFISSRG